MQNEAGAQNMIQLYVTNVRFRKSKIKGGRQDKTLGSLSATVRGH